MKVISWLNRQKEQALFLPTPVIAELSAGAHEFARRTGSNRYLAPLKQLLEIYSDRTVDFTTTDALTFGRVIARRNEIGRPIKAMDAMIAAICIANGATLATRNVRDFEGLDLTLINPFEA